MARIPAAVKATIERFRVALEREIRVDRLVLFGSYAHGAPDAWSDIDLAVVSPDLGDPRRDVPLLARIRVAIDPALAPVPLTPGQWQSVTPGSLVREIRLTGIDVYVRGVDRAA